MRTRAVLQPIQVLPQFSVARIHGNGAREQRRQDTRGREARGTKGSVWKMRTRAGARVPQGRTRREVEVLNLLGVPPARPRRSRERTPDARRRPGLGSDAKATGLDLPMRLDVMDVFNAAL